MSRLAASSTRFFNWFLPELSSKFHPTRLPQHARYPHVVEQFASVIGLVEQLTITFIFYQKPNGALKIQCDMSVSSQR